jgi:hypothetical protein
MENIIYPMLVSTLASEDCFEQGIDCLTLFLYYNSERGVNKQLWKLFPQIVQAVMVEQGENGGSFEKFPGIGLAIQNYISRDP